MGTRGAVGWKLDGKYFFTYNHFDSYPSVLGAEMLELMHTINKNDGWEKLRKNIKALAIIDDDQKQATPELAKKYSKYSEGLSGHPPTEWYALLRKIQGASTIAEVYKGKLKHVIDCTSFILNSLFCEYAYAFNLDDMTFEFFRGFQTKKHKSPFKMVKNDGYYPCKLIGSFKFKEYETALFAAALTEDTKEPHALLDWYFKQAGETE